MKREIACSELFIASRDPTAPLGFIEEPFDQISRADIRPMLPNKARPRVEDRRLLNAIFGCCNNSAAAAQARDIRSASAENARKVAFVI
jgi:hypothetical protein